MDSKKKDIILDSKIYDNKLEVWIIQSDESEEEMEDAYSVFDNNEGNNIIITLSDGLGGHPYGKQASETLVQAVGEIPYRSTEQFVKEINDCLVQKKECGYATMSSIFINFSTEKIEVLYINSGDTTIHRIDNSKGKLEQLSINHTDEKEYLERGLDELTARFYAKLTSCIGIEQQPEYHAGKIEINKQDVLVLATDGGYSLLVESAWKETVRLKYPKIQRNYIYNLLHRNISKADDNITVAIVTFCNF